MPLDRARDTPTRLHPAQIRRAIKPAQGERGTVVPGGSGSFDFQYIEDAAHSVVLALDAPDLGGRTFLTHGDQRPVRSAFEFVTNVLPGSEMRQEQAPGMMIFGGDGSGIPQFANAVKLPQDRLFEAESTFDAIGYRPRFSMEAGLLETINAVRRHANLPTVEMPSTDA